MAERALLSQRQDAYAAAIGSGRAHVVIEIEGDNTNSIPLAKLAPHGKKTPLGIVGFGARIIMYAALFGILLATLELVRASFLPPGSGRNLEHAALASRFLIGFASLLVGSYAYSSEGPLHKQVASILLCSLAVHTAILVLPAFRDAPGSYDLALIGSLGSAVLGTGIAAAKFSIRKRDLCLIADGLPPQLLKDLRNAAHVITGTNVDPSEFDVIVFNQQALSKPAWAIFIARAAAAGCELQPVTRYIREKIGRVHLDYVDPQDLKRVSSHPYHPLKRAMDILVILAAAPLVLFLVGLASIAILVTMGGPILFVQDRVGLDGRIFPMYKLRTMRMRAAHEPQIATAKGDSRITPLGKFLRRFHIDELPQMWNVLKGDMTLIGPRPEQPSLVNEYAAHLPGYDLRHMVRPGISGWSQVKYGYASTLEETREKLEFDLFYLEQFGPLLDAKIIAKTVLAMFDPDHVR